MGAARRDDVSAVRLAALAVIGALLFAATLAGTVAAACAMAGLEALHG